MIKIGELSIDKLYIGELEVGKAYLGENLVYGGESEGSYLLLEFDAPTSFQIKDVSASVPAPTAPTIYYSFDGKTYQEMQRMSDGHFEVINDITKIYLYGDNPDGINKGSQIRNFRFYSTGGTATVSGEIMALISKDSSLHNEIPCNYCFAGLMRGDVFKVNNVDNLKMSATTLKDGCYLNMFQYCTFRVAPELPAKNLASRCYEGVFANNPNIKEIHYYADQAPSRTYSASWLYLSNLYDTSAVFYKYSDQWTGSGSGSTYDRVPDRWQIVDMSNSSRMASEPVFSSFQSLADEFESESGSTETSGTTTITE